MVPEVNRREAQKLERSHAAEIRVDYEAVAGVVRFGDQSLESVRDVRDDPYRVVLRDPARGPQSAWRADSHGDRLMEQDMGEQEPPGKTLHEWADASFELSPARERVQSRLEEEDDVLRYLGRRPFPP